MAQTKSENDAGSAIITTHTIRYHRPQQNWSVVNMTVPDGADAALTQKIRLEALGYEVIDVAPTLPAVGAVSTHAETT
jgi:hypothetical protein